MRLLKKNMEWFIKNLTASNSTNAQVSLITRYLLFRDRVLG